MRLCLDPELGRPPETSAFSRLYEHDLGGATGGGGGSNPLVFLLALGGVGSTAAKQLHYDSDAEEDDLEDAFASDQSSRKYQLHLQQAFGGEHVTTRRKQQSDADSARLEQRKKDEAKRRRKQVKARIKAKQNEIIDDTMLQLCYANESHAMERIVSVLRSASRAWVDLQHGDPARSVTPSQVSTFVNAYPPTLLVDCIDFLSFLALRHSIVFQEFCLSTGLIEALVNFFPRPNLTSEELAKEAQRQQQEASAHASASSSSATTGMSGLDTIPPFESQASTTSLGAPSPSPTSAKPLVDFRAPIVTPPISILCAALRFVRIVLEIDPIYIQPVSWFETQNRLDESH